MDLDDVAGGAVTASNVLSEVIKKFSLYVDEGHADADELRSLKERLAALNVALNHLASVIADSDGTTLEEVTAQCSEVWILIGTAVKDCKVIAKHLRQSMRRNSLRPVDDNASQRSTSPLGGFLEENDIKRSVFQTESHELILKTGLDLLLLVASSRAPNHDSRALQQATNSLRRQLIRIESVRGNIEMEDDDIVDDTTRQAMANANQLKAKAQVIITQVRSNIAEPRTRDSRTSVDSSETQLNGAAPFVTGSHGSMATTKVDRGEASDRISIASNQDFYSVNDVTESQSSLVTGKASYSDLEPLLGNQQVASQNTFPFRSRSVPHQYQAYRPHLALPYAGNSYESQAYELSASPADRSVRSPSQDLHELLQSRSNTTETQPPVEPGRVRAGQFPPTSNAENLQSAVMSSHEATSPAQNPNWPVTSLGNNAEDQVQRPGFRPYRIPTNAFDPDSASLREGIQLLRDHRYIDEHIKDDLMQIKIFPTNIPYLIRQMTDALRPACRMQDKNATKVILQIGGNPNIQSDTEPKLTLLIELVKRQRIELVKILSDGGANVNAQIDDCPFSYSPNPLKKSSIQGKLSALSYAALGGYEDIVEALVARRADVDFTTGDKGLRPVFLAALAGHASVVERLLAADSRPFSEKEKYNVVLNVAHVAAWSGKISVMDVLFRSPRAENLFGRQNLIFFEGYWDLADKQAWKYEKLPDNGTALHAAILGKEKALEATDFILKKGILPVDTPDPNGRTALHLSVTYFRQAHENIIQKLLDYHANINARDRQGRTPLHVLVRQSPKFEADILILLRLVRDFLARGANPNQPDNDGITPKKIRMRLYPDSFNAKRRFSMPEDSVNKYNRKYTNELEKIFNRIPTDDMIVVTDELDPR